MENRNIYNMNITIIGSGIAGTALYAALHKSGFNVQLFAKSEEITGGVLTLWPNALHALRGLDLDELVLQAGTPKITSHVMNVRGKTIVRVPIHKIRDAHGVPVISIARNKLGELLKGTVPSDYVTANKECSGFTLQENKAVVLFKDGSYHTTDLLVGTDGIHSIIRSSLFGWSAPRYAGRVSWNGVAMNVKLPLEENGVYEIQGAGKRIGFTAIGPGTVGWYANMNQPEDFSPPQNPVPYLLQHFHNWPMNITSLFECTDPAIIRAFKIQDRDPISSWSQSCVTLAGDAAHPMTPDAGQGACQAIEDAVVLTRCLLKNPNITEAIRQYEFHRIPRTTEIVNYARKIGRISNWDKPWSVWVRELMFRSIPPDKLVAPFIKLANFKMP